MNPPLKGVGLVAVLTWANGPRFRDLRHHDGSPAGTIASSRPIGLPGAMHRSA